MVSVDSVWLLLSCLQFQLMKRKESGESRKWLLLEMKLIDWPKYSWCSAKESSVLSKRSVDSKQKNRRCSAKESTILFKRSDDAKRKQPIYSQISLNCYVSGGNNTGQKHSRIIVFPLGLLWNCLSVAFLSLDLFSAKKGVKCLLVRPNCRNVWIELFSIQSPVNFYWTKSIFAHNSLMNRLGLKPFTGHP